MDSRTQEGPQQFVQRETVYGQAYNARTFLQENALTPHARVDPGALMSTNYNQNLERVRCMTSLPKRPVDYPTEGNGQQPPGQGSNGETLVSPVLYPTSYDELYTTKYITEHTDGYSRRSTARVYDSPFKGEHDRAIYKVYEQQASGQPQTISFDPHLSIPAALPRGAKTAIRLPGPEVVARYVEPTGEPSTTYQRSYKDITFHESMPQIQGLNRSGRVRSQSMRNQVLQTSRVANSRDKEWKLRDLQDRWSKTQAQRDYHMAYPEAVPDVGGCTIRAKKEILIADTLAKRGMLTVR